MVDYVKFIFLVFLLNNYSYYLMYSKYAETVFKSVLMNKFIKPVDLLMSSGSEAEKFSSNFFFLHFLQS